MCHALLLLLPQLQHKLSEARSTLCNSIDPNTGKRLFHPETGRAPRFSRNTSQQPVSEYLFSLSQQQVGRNQGFCWCWHVGLLVGVVGSVIHASVAAVGVSVAYAWPAGSMPAVKVCGCSCTTAMEQARQLWPDYPLSFPLAALRR